MAGSAATPIADEAAAATGATDTSSTSSTPDPTPEPEPAKLPGPGALVRVDDADGTPIRYGIVVDKGRTPGQVAAPNGQIFPESAEPVVLWFSETPSPYGGALVEVETG